MAAAVDPVEEAIGERKWLSPGLARKLLDVNEATLRHWADTGLIRTFRTPGGHRRVSSDDIRELIEKGQQSHQGPPLNVPEVVLPRIRRKLSGHQTGAPPWRSQFDSSGQEEMRALGRELVDLCLESLDHPRQREVMAKARSLGAHYEEASARQGLSLPDAVQAFVFFRGAMLEALRPALLRHCGSTHELSWCWQQLGRITDEVLLSMTRTFQSAGAALESAVVVSP